MNLHSWLRSSAFQLVHSLSLHRKLRRGRRNTRPASELLETRILLAAIMWDGGADGNGTSWNDRFNWVGDQLPDAADDVTIDHGANDFTVVHSSDSHSVHSLTSHAKLDLSGGILEIADSSFIYNDFSLAGTLTGTGDITVDGQLTFEGGTLHSTGVLTSNGSMTIGFVSLGGTLVANGYTTWNGLEIDAYGAPAVFVNNGTFDISSGGPMLAHWGVSGTLINNGLIIKEGAANTADLRWMVTNHGSIEVEAGSLLLGAGVNSSGSYHGLADTRLSIAGSLTPAARIEGFDIGLQGDMVVPLDYLASHSTSLANGIIAFPNSMRGVGNLTVANATVSFSDTVVGLGSLNVPSGTVDFSDAGGPITYTIPSLSLQGTLRGSDSFTVDGQLTFEGGTLHSTGVLTSNGSMTIGFVSLGGTLVANGYTTWNGLEIDAYGAPAVFVNNGTFDISSGGPMLAHWGVSGTLINNGLIIKEGAANTADLRWIVTNHGSIEVEAGSLLLGAGVNSSGTFHAAVGSTLSLSGQTLTAASTVTGAGTVALSNSTVGGSYAVTGLTIVGGGLVNFTGAAGPVTIVLGSLAINSGATLMGTDDFIVTGTLNWNDGTLQGVDGHGSLTVFTNTTLNGNYILRDFTLINAADMTWTGGTVQFYGSTGGFVNSAGATFTNSFDGTFGSVDGNCLQFVNNGHFVKSADTGTTYLQMQLYNRGTIAIQQGQLYLGCGYVGTPGNPPPPGVDPGPVPPFYEDPDPRPLPPDTPPLIIPGSYTQAVSGRLIEQIAGHSGGTYGTSGTDYGQLVVHGNVALNGSFEVQVVGGFVPSLGQQYMVIDNRGSHPIGGTFIGLPEGAIVWAGNYGFSVSYTGGDGNDFVLTMDQFANIPPTAPVDTDFALNEILENSSTGTVGITAFSTNSELSDTVIYSLCDDAAGRFTIDPITGVVTVANGALLDYEADTSHSITVEASDGQGGKSTQSFTINVLNVTATISGTVFMDADGDGLFDGGSETAIDAVMIELYNSAGGLLDTDLTSLGGVYAFTVNDEYASYRIREIQPTGVNNGTALLGSAGGEVLSANEMRLALTGINASDYDFTESGQALHAGDTASIGFWQNKNGQALINLGGPALVNWLNSHFGNIFGNTFTDGVGGDTAAEVASFYKDQFFHQKLNGTPKVDAQFMATALATFFTSSNLSGGNVAASYGFHVTQTGLGTKVVNIGNSGDAFGVANNTNMTIMSLLLATNHLTGARINGYSNVYDTNGDGVLDDNEKALRFLANTIYSVINESGHIS